jgi:hypothetical protein
LPSPRSTFSNPDQSDGHFHDWTLVRIVVEWQAGTVRLDLQSPSGSCSLHAVGLQDLRVPQANPWGKSVSINATRGPTGILSQDSKTFALEMQSGDVIEITARSFAIPLE